MGRRRAERGLPLLSVSVRWLGGPTSCTDGEMFVLPTRPHDGRAEKGGGSAAGRPNAFRQRHVVQTILGGEVQTNYNFVLKSHMSAFAKNELHHRSNNENPSVMGTSRSFCCWLLFPTPSPSIAHLRHAGDGRVLRRARGDPRPIQYRLEPLPPPPAPAPAAGSGIGDSWDVDGARPLFGRGQRPLRQFGGPVVVTSARGCV